MWGIIPAVGSGTSIRPLAFSKELLPVGGSLAQGGQRPKAVSDYVVERMQRAGVNKLCFVIAPDKADLVRYYGCGTERTQLCYVVQPEPAGLCDAIFRALPLMRDDEPVLIGLPDTVWFPEDGYRALPAAGLSLLLFPVRRPELFEAVISDERGCARAIQVKRPQPDSHWIWGGVRTSGSILTALHARWLERRREDSQLGTLLDDYIARGGEVRCVRAGRAYYDAGTLDGYRQAMQTLDGVDPLNAASNLIGL